MGDEVSGETGTVIYAKDSRRDAELSGGTDGCRV